MLNFKTFTRLLSIYGLIIIISACSLRDIKEQSEQLENAAQISGNIVVDEKNKYPVYVMLFKMHPTSVEIINLMLLESHNQYQFDVFPGEYVIAAYIDENDNQTREPFEKAAIYTQGTSLYKTINVQKGEKYIVDSFAITEVIDTSGHVKATVNISKIYQNIGKIVSLDDEMFSKQNANLGLWQPIEFAQQVGGGLMMLQPYEKNKTPIVYIHGISGSPTEFSALINQLDRDHYQPWVLSYPSGMPLDLVSNYLLKSLLKLQARHGFSNIGLITHSMGGLMSRSFLMKHQQKEINFDISLLVTINSPLYGMKSAASGVESSPIVIASWRDLATNSEYVARVHRWSIPKEIPYHLFFSYLPGEEGDGVVPLSSQLSLSLQDEATKIHGFEAQHVEILENEIFIERLNDILSELN